MNNLNLKNTLDDADLTQLTQMVNYWEEVRRREDTEPLQHEWRQVAGMLNVRLLAVIQDYLVLKKQYDRENGCQCLACQDLAHSSDCSVHNAPALSVGECDCVSVLGT